MSIFKRKAESRGDGGNFELPPEGPQVGTCVALIDLGTHEETFAGAPKKARKILYVWELAERRQDGKPFVVGERYTLSLHEKSKLRAVLGKWRAKPIAEGEEVDLGQWLGKPCLLTLAHERSKSNPDRTYVKLLDVGGLPRQMAGLVPAQPEHEPFAWSVEDGGPAPDMDWLPYVYGESVADVVSRCHERRGAASAPTRNGVYAPPLAAGLVDPDETPYAPRNGVAYEDGEEIPF